MLSAFSIIVRLAWNLLQWCEFLLRPRESLEAEILFLRRQLALYRERGVKPRRVSSSSLEHALTHYVAHYHEERNHQGYRIAC